MSGSTIAWMLDWIRVESSMVAVYRYDKQAQRLYVEFREGGSGYYSHVPATVAREFATAPSIGRFVIQRLRNNPNYPWTALTQAPPRPRSPRVPRVRTPPSSSSEPLYRYRCPVCGYVSERRGTGARMGKHKRKGDPTPARLAIPCAGSGAPGIPLGPVTRPRRRR